MPTLLRTSGAYNKLQELVKQAKQRQGRAMHMNVAAGGDTTPADAGAPKTPAGSPPPDDGDGNDGDIDDGDGEPGSPTGGSPSVAMVSACVGGVSRCATWLRRDLGVALNRTVTASW